MCPRVQKRASDPLQLDLQAVVNCLICILGPKLVFLQGPQMLLTAEPFPHHQKNVLSILIRNAHQNILSELSKARNDL